MSDNNGTRPGPSVDLEKNVYAIDGIDTVESPEYVLGFWCPAHKRFEGTGEVLGSLNDASKAASDMFGRLVRGGATSEYLVAVVCAKIGTRAMVVAVAQAEVAEVVEPAITPPSIITPGS